MTTNGKIVIFENGGEIDVRSISTFGCSVKEGENPIGFFGTGLKYALAVLMRLGIKVVIQSGLNQYEVCVSAGNIRGRDFGFVGLRGENGGVTGLGFTTELGKTWQLWMAYRELFCNAKDELGRAMTADSIPSPSTDKTRLIVVGKDFAKIHADSSEFLLESIPTCKIGGIEIHPKPSETFFYRGIKVMSFQKPALYTYNQTESMDLTEDRTAKSPYEVCYKIARDVMAYASGDVLERILTAPESNIEFHFDYHGWTGTTPSADFLNAVGKLQRDSLMKINPTAVRVWREKTGGFIDPRRVKITTVQSAMLQKAIGFCEDSGFKVRDEYPIIIVETLGGNGILALADLVGKQILLTEQVFQTGGTKGVARAIIEEYLHLKFGLDDCTRPMQNWLFDKVVSLAEELKGEPL